MVGFAAAAKAPSTEAGGQAARTCTPGAEISGLIWPRPSTGPRELKPAISPIKPVLKNGFMRIGNSEIAPFAGLLSSDAEMALISTWPSAVDTLAEGIVLLTAVGFSVVEIRITPTAPEAAAMFAT